MKVKTLLATAFAIGLSAPGLTFAESSSGIQLRDEAGYASTTLDARVSRLEKRVSGQPLVDMSRDIERLQEEVKKLRGTVEELRNGMDKARKLEREHYAALEKRNEELEAKFTPLLPPPPPSVVVAPADSTAVTPGSATTPLTPGSAAAPINIQNQPATSPPVAGVNPAQVPGSVPMPETIQIPEAVVAPPPPDPKIRQQDYERAFEKLKAGRYTDAIAEFQTFVAKYPTGEYSDNAQYWLGEAHYVNRDFVAARESFRKMTTEFPQSSKVADAELKLAFIEYENQQYGKAKGMLNELIRKHPNSSAAQMAQKRLDRMKQENH